MSWFPSAFPFARGKRCSAIFLSLLVWWGPESACGEDDLVEYNRDVRPILAGHCFACHGLDNLARQADLRLDLRDDAIDGGALVPGDPDASELIARVLTDASDEVMPPPESKKSLTDAQKQTLVRWVEQGGHYEQHWALIKPIKTTPPESVDTSWTKNPIDSFVLKRLTEQGLSPAPEASPHQLFRRLSLDITGLPPTPEDSQLFAKTYEDNPDQAMSEWIDRLMQSKAWGEHRGRYWLDAARYADTHGMHFDNYREMWPYRDWVIRSFNRNQPFDEFTIEQLAGDLLDESTTDQLIATGFQRCAMTTNEGGTIDEENLAIYAADRVQTFGWVYLGLTTNCCQCHDHKFDPISIKDYYSLAAFFRNTTQPAKDRNAKDGGGPTIVVPSEMDMPRWSVIDNEISTAKTKRDDHVVQATTSFEQWLGGASVEASPSNASSAVLDSIERLEPVLGRLTRIRLDGDQKEDLKLALNRQSASYLPAATGELEWVSEGASGESVRFRSGHTIEVGELGDFAVQDAFSVSAWVRVSNLDQSAAVVARMDDQNKHRGWDLFISAGKLSFHLIHAWPEKALKVSTKAKALKANQWHHICVTYDGSTKPDGVKVYIDASDQPLQVDNDSLEINSDVRTTTPFRIGQRSQGSIFEGGSVQDVQIFSRVLEPSEAVFIGNAPALKKALLKKATDRSEEERKQLLDHFLKHNDPTYVALNDEVVRLETERAGIVDRSPLTHVQVERDDRPAMANILLRGAYDSIGEEVLAETPQALHPMDSALPRNRLGLAKWVVADDNPLTARVTVNRFWQEVFGQGIVTTAEDFGVMGAPPSHPELLDWLAIDFVESGWDVKRFFKQIFMSATYRQAAVTTADKLLRDRDNLLLSRGPRFRMDAEMVRDHALAASGLLSSTMFGPGTRPYQPTNIWNMVGLPGGDTREYEPDTGEGVYRRSLYNFWKRMSPPPSLETFNAPNREVCTVRRERTNTPLQALVTLNDPQFVEAARKLAELAIAQCGDNDREILGLMYWRVLGRPIHEDEFEVIMQTKRDLVAHYKAHPGDASKLLNVGQSDMNPKIELVSLATWTLTANQLMNLDETLCK
ncbi:DUF1553 domain-containing protein [Rubripirellula amarantea]|nr:DUF1553 domain-containing protein [Rubripirellula amarantea]